MPRCDEHTESLRYCADERVVHQYTAMHCNRDICSRAIRLGHQLDDGELLFTHARAHCTFVSASNREREPLRTRISSGQMLAGFRMHNRKRNVKMSWLRPTITIRNTVNISVLSMLITHSVHLIALGKRAALASMLRCVASMGDLV